MPDLDHLRALLREHWHLAPTGIGGPSGTPMARSWEVSAGSCHYRVRLADRTARASVEAGLAAAEHLLARGEPVGAPVRTLGGALAADTEHGVMAVVSRVPGRPLTAGDPADRWRWGERLAATHHSLRDFRHPGLRAWNAIDLAAPHLTTEPWLLPAVAAAAVTATRLTITDRLTYGVLHGDPEPGGFVAGPDGLIDCGMCGTGPLVLDVAAAVVAAGGTPDPEFLNGYLAAAPVLPDEMEVALPVLLRFRWALLADSAARRLAAPATADGCRDQARDTLHQARAALESPAA